jgi:signal peptidase I
MRRTASFSPDAIHGTWSSETPALDRRRAFHRVANAVFVAAFLLATIGWWTTLRPDGLGGSASYVMVRGVSMLPAYRSGDLVVTRRQASYGPGEVVAYRIPSGELGAGMVVIHRITGGSPSAGFTTKGDNTPDADVWRPRPDQILGRAWIRIPRIGVVLAALRGPLPLASLATGISVAVALVPPRRSRTVRRLRLRGRPRRDRTGPES